MSRFQLFIIVVIFSCLTSEAATISGGGQVVESTPAPPRKFAEDPTPTPGPTLGGDIESLPKPESLTGGETPQDVEIDVSAPAPTVATNEFRAAMAMAAKDFKDRKFDEAFANLNRAEKLDPTSPDVINFRGAIYAEKGEFGEAKKRYEQALKTQPTAFWPKYNLAEIEFMQKRYDVARDSFGNLMEQYPKNELVQFKIMLTYLLEYKESEARAALDQFAFPSNTPAYYFAWAAWEFGHGKTKEGNDWIDSGVRIFGREKTDFVYQSLADLKYVPMPRP